MLKSNSQPLVANLNTQLTCKFIILCLISFIKGFFQKGTRYINTNKGLIGSIFNRKQIDFEETKCKNVVTKLQKLKGLFMKNSLDLVQNVVKKANFKIW